MIWVFYNVQMHKNFMRCVTVEFYNIEDILDLPEGSMKSYRTAKDLESTSKSKLADFRLLFGENKKKEESLDHWENRLENQITMLEADREDVQQWLESRSMIESMYATVMKSLNSFHGQASSAVGEDVGMKEIMRAYHEAGEEAVKSKEASELRDLDEKWVDLCDKYSVSDFEAVSNMISAREDRTKDELEEWREAKSDHERKQEELSLVIERLDSIVREEGTVDTESSLDWVSSLDRADYESKVKISDDLDGSISNEKKQRKAEQRIEKRKYFSTNRLLTTLKGHSNWVLAVSNLGDGRVASGSGDKTIRIWDINKRKRISTLNGHTGTVYCLSNLGDGKLASGSWDRIIKIWDLDTRQCISTLNGHTNCVNCLSNLGDGKLASGSHDKTIKIWDLDTRQCISTLNGHTSGVYCLSNLGDGKLASGSSDKTIKIWDLDTRQCISTLNGHTDCVNCLSNLGDGKLASGSADNTIRIWDLDTRKCISTLNGHTSYVYCLSNLGDGKLASGSRDKTIRIWDLDTRQCISTLNGHTNTVVCLSNLEDGKLVSGSGDQTIKIWEFGDSSPNSRCVIQ